MVDETPSPLLVYELVTSNPYTFWEEVVALAVRAARLAANSSALWPVRGRAAALCLTLSNDLAPNEALCAEFVRAAFACAETFPIVADLVAAAQAIAPDDSNLVTPLRRLCSNAHRAGHHSTVVVTLVRLLEVDAFKGNLPQVWLVDARDMDHEAGYWLVKLVRRWVSRFGGGNEGIRALIRGQQDRLFLVRRAPLPEVLRLHAAEPTAAGWLALARRRHELPPGPLPLSFGDRTADALVTLQEARSRGGEQEHMFALGNWIAALTSA